MESIFESGLNLPQRFFSPPAQDDFWQNLDPNVNDMLRVCEEREDWVCAAEGLPPLFVALSSALPRVCRLPYGQGGDTLLHALVSILAVLPLRASVAAVSWLDHKNMEIVRDADKRSDDELNIGWGVGLYLFAKQYGEDGRNDDWRRCCLLLCSRVELVMRTELVARLFSPSDIWSVGGGADDA